MPHRVAARYNVGVIYDLAADLTAAVHLTFIFFVLFGVILGRRSRTWRWLHIGSMVYGVFIEFFYWDCPLTSLEQYLRRRAGRGIYEEPFIAHYLNQIIYLDVPQWSLILVAAVVLVCNLTLYIIWSRHTRRRAS